MVDANVPDIALEPDKTVKKVLYCVASLLPYMLAEDQDVGDSQILLAINSFLML